MNNKKLLSLFIIAPILLSGCSITFNFGGGISSSSHHGGDEGFVPVTSTGDDDKDRPEEPTFSIRQAYFTDDQGHLRVDYTCNYPTPFNVTGHTFSKLNITGVISRELDYSHEGYFTLLSPIVSTSLKFEFYDIDENIYISMRYQDVTLYDSSKPVQTIDYPEGYNTLYWSDEFDGDHLDTSKWTYEIGNGDWGWGNNEAQYYTDHNDTVKDGILTISAKKENISNFNYTSTRIKTQNKVKFTYGYIEAKIALPTINGMWPAFWMMPNDSYYGGWPHSGEIDIMEAKGRIPNQSSSALHFSNSGGHTYLANERNGHNIADFHKYAVEWKENSIKYYVDDICHFVIRNYQWSSQNAPSSEVAPFDKDFYIILNLAVGGHFDNYVMPPENFSNGDMKIDYVRVFK